MKKLFLVIVILQFFLFSLFSEENTKEIPPAEQEQAQEQEQEIPEDSTNLDPWEGLTTDQKLEKILDLIYKKLVEDSEVLTPSVDVDEPMEVTLYKPDVIIVEVEEVEIHFEIIVHCYNLEENRQIVDILLEMIRTDISDLIRSNVNLFLGEDIAEDFLLEINKKYSNNKLIKEIIMVSYLVKEA
ncbi:MAG: hypothetical protein JXR63_05745 [Spirochaetales bacterium]|nr:hypothetical protein [Spirochaetales bacterium]